MRNIKSINLCLTYFFLIISLLSYSNNKFPFVENKGQLPKKLFSKVKIPGGSIYIEKGKLTYSFYNTTQLQEIHELRSSDTWIDAHSFNVKFIKSNKQCEVNFSDKSAYFENFYNTKIWVEDVHFYKSITKKNIYNKIDFKMYLSEGNLKYDFIVHPFGDSKKIKLKYSGQEKISLENGNLVIKTSVNTVTELKPFAYQIVNSEKVAVMCNFKLKGDVISYNFPEGYDKNQILIIDPVLIFSTYSGSTSDNFGYTATYDQDGFLYSAGTVFNDGNYYPTTTGAFQINHAGGTGVNGGTDIAITKYDTTGTVRIYSTYLGGSYSELPHSLIVNKWNELFVFGTSGSNDYPTTNNAFQQNFGGGVSFSPSGLGVSFPNGSDMIISRLSSNGGGLISSTYIGGSDNDGLNTAQKLKRNYADEVRGEIDIDNNNNIYLASCTYSADFPTTNSFQMSNNGGQEGCIIKMDNDLSTIIWSSYLGGSNDDAIYSLALDNKDNIFVTGGTTSNDFPVSTNAYQNYHQDSIKADAFISHISDDGNLIINSSYFGSPEYDQSYFVELNSEEQVYIFGQTKAIGNALVYNASYFDSDGGQFIATLSNDLEQLIRSTVFGTGNGTPDISPTAFLVDICNNIYISGWGGTTGNGPLSTLNMPVTTNAYQASTDGNDFYIMVLDNGLNNLMYGTYFGGSQSAEHVDGGTSRFDKKGMIYQAVCAGCTGNSDFPIHPNPGAVSSTNNSVNCNNAVFKLDFDFPILIADFNSPYVMCYNTISFTNLSHSSTNTSYLWDFGDGNTSTQTNPSHQYTSPGVYDVMLIAMSPNSCNLSDTITKQIHILANNVSYLDEINVCRNIPVQIGLSPTNNPSISYLWTPSIGINNLTIPNPIVTIDSSVLYKLIISDGLCADTLYQWVNVDSLKINAVEDTSFCKDPILLTSNVTGSITSILWSTSSNFLDTISITNSFVANNVGAYFILAKNENCMDIDSIEVKSEDMLIELSGITEICMGDSVFIKADDLSSLNPIISYLWESEYDLFFVTDSSSFIAYPDSSTFFKVTATNTLGCFIIDSILVDVYQYPIYDSIWASHPIIYEGEETTLNISTNDNILWETNDTLSSILVSPESSNMYNFILHNEFCQIEDSIYIEVKDVFCDEEKIIIPNAFTPNKDNINDYYRIVDTDNIIKGFTLEIFNRFGEKVYSSNDIHEKWDGYFKGILLSSQVFDFYLEVECIGEKKLFKKGNISLIR